MLSDDGDLGVSLVSREGSGFTFRVGSGSSVASAVDSVMSVDFIIPGDCSPVWLDPQAIETTVKRPTNIARNQRDLNKFSATLDMSTIGKIRAPKLIG